jgi:5-methylcytosine-specific restriction endonuclease McrA
MPGLPGGLVKQKTYYETHPEKWDMSSPIKKAARNTRLRERYHADQAFREQRLAMNILWYAQNRELRRLYNALFRKRRPDLIYAIAQRRRARLRNAPRVEKIDRAHIIARDRGRCHICGLKVRVSERSLDHLIPLAHGGNHTEDNLALAHFRCNSRMGAGRLPAQLRLFG